MRPVTRICLPVAASPALSTRVQPLQCRFRPRHHGAPSPTRPPSSSSLLRPRPFHSSAAVANPLPTSSRPAVVVPMYGQGPPPDPPEPLAGRSNGQSLADSGTSSSSKKKVDPARDAEERAIRIARRKTLAAKTSASDSNRFWKTTGVEEVNGGDDGGSHLQVRLDTRPLRHPGTKQILRLPPQKKLLAHALAAEWDQLASVRQATQGHRVPLTSLVCRAVDLEEESGNQNEQQQQQQPRRTALIENLLRYLDTDSLLCWAPPDEVDALHGGGVHAAATRNIGGREITLRQLQESTAGPILAYMAAHVWPGVAVEPVLGGADQGNMLFPKAHPPETRAAVARWLEGLSGWDLAGVERATLAGKSIVVASRLVAGWSSTAAPGETGSALSVEDAYAATNMETAFQTAQWGEVEDTHDVDRVDMRRHFGSVVLLVS